MSFLKPHLPLCHSVHGLLAGRTKLKSIPSKPGVYLFKDKQGQIIYIGKAKSLRKRISSYFKKASDIKTSILLERLDDIDYIVVGSEMEALILEAELIKKYKPRYNVSWRDDKAYPYLKLTLNEKWPRLFLVRKKKKDGALYFGPYEGGMVRAIIRLIKKMFAIRWCKESPLRMREQPCLYARIGSCTAPCVNKISREEYLALVQGITLLLQGKMEKALLKLKEQMQKASQRLDYERAKEFRERIRLLGKMLATRGLSHAPAPRKFSEIMDLQKELRLKRLPMRIEAFDISNTQKANIVGSMVVFLGGAPLRADYRRFKIRSLSNKPNDVAAIYEVVKRRYGKTLAKKLDLPDMVLVDGGKPQLNAALKATREAGLDIIPVISLAKREEKIYMSRPARPLQLSKHCLSLQLLQRIRDEAHRFAVHYHRLKRKKGLYR